MAIGPTTRPDHHGAAVLDVHASEQSRELRGLTQEQRHHTSIDDHAYIVTGRIADDFDLHCAAALCTAHSLRLGPIRNGEEAGQLLDNL